MRDLLYSKIFTGGGEVKNPEKLADVICERPLGWLMSNVAAALVRTQGPNKIDRTFCLSQTCLASVPVLHWPKCRYGLSEEGTCLWE